MEKIFFRPGGMELTGRLAEQIGIGPDSEILDIGCGAGATLLFLKEKYGCRVSGVDLSPEAAAKARSVVPEADVRCENAACLSFEDSSFDAAFMECTLTLFDDPHKALKEAYRVLKSGGALVISVITADGPEPVQNGAADPGALVRALNGTGFKDISRSDEKNALTQLLCDIIFEYGSMEEYLRDAEERLGGTVLNCDLKKKGISYGVFICRK